MSAPNRFNAFAAKMIAALGGATEVHVGFLEGSTAGWNGPRPKGATKAWKRTEKAPQAVPGVPAAYVAAILEYGNPAKNLPPRPFFSGMVTKQAPTWGKLVAAALRANGYDTHKALGLVGLTVKAQLQAAINEFSEPDILQATKDRKGFDQPLIDSHNMINSVDYVVT